MDTPKPKDICEATGISPSYASMILNGLRTPARSLAIHIYRRTGWRHGSIADLTDEQMNVLEEVDPWVGRSNPRGAEAA